MNTLSICRYLSGTSIQAVGKGTFSVYPLLKELFFRDTSSESCKLSYLEPGVFDDLNSLEALGMIGCGHLTSLQAGVLGAFQNLETLHIYRSGLIAVPDFSHFHTVNPDMEGVMKEIDLHNNKIERIHAYDFANVRTDTLKLEGNMITKIDSNAFKNATIVDLLINKNEHLQEIQEGAFDGVDLIKKLDLSSTKISSLPTQGLNNLRHLVLKSTPSLKYFPSVLEFTKIERAELTYPHHCCAFKNPEKQNPSAWKAKQAQERINRDCASTTAPPVATPNKDQMSFSNTEVTPPNFQTFGEFDSTVPPEQIPSRNKRNSFGSFPSTMNETEDSPTNNVDPMFGDFGETNDVNKHGGGHGMVFHKSTVPVDENITQNAFCGEIYVYNRNITCTPEPDAFNPCEDVMGYVWLRVTVWFVLLAALLGNSVVLIVLITSRGKFTVPKFLMCNLAFGDLLMGVYLILLASIDIHTLGEYFNYAVQWQNEGGCQTAGFLSVFASELSIFTLTILTLERWYAITHAIHLNKRLKLRQSMFLMVLGYLFAIVLALLPLVGVSGYGNVSICLPMKADNGVDIGYVVSLLVMNGVMFLAICFCYINMYWKVKGSATTARSNDATIAKRMALLVFTNFACWAPIAFFGLTASAGVPLIDITNSKILLVFFYPLNSCANPFLYAILTKQFRKDVFILLGKYGICVEKANQYRGTCTSRSMSQSRGHNKDQIMRGGHHRNSESIFSHLTDSNQISKFSVNNVPKIHPCHNLQSEVQPFIEKSHIDRAVEFANKESELADDQCMDVWVPGGPGLIEQNERPYIRSVSCYTQLNTRKTSAPKLNASYNRMRNSVETFLSNSTDMTILSDNTNTSEDIWQIREVEHTGDMGGTGEHTESEDDHEEHGDAAGYHGNDTMDESQPCLYNGDTKTGNCQHGTNRDNYNHTGVGFADSLSSRNAHQCGSVTNSEQTELIPIASKTDRLYSNRNNEDLNIKRRTFQNNRNDSDHDFGKNMETCFSVSNGYEHLQDSSNELDDNNADSLLDIEIKCDTGSKQEGLNKDSESNTETCLITYNGGEHHLVESSDNNMDAMLELDSDTRGKTNNKGSDNSVTSVKRKKETCLINGHDYDTEDDAKEGFETGVLNPENNIETCISRSNGHQQLLDSSEDERNGMSHIDSECDDDTVIIKLDKCKEGGFYSGVALGNGVQA